MVEDEETVLEPLRGRDLAGLAANPGDSEHIVEVDEDFLTGQCSYHVTFDGGETWLGGDLVAPEGYPTPPCPVFDSNGYAHSRQRRLRFRGERLHGLLVRGGGGDSVLVPLD